MASGPSEKGRTIRLSTELFLHIELVVYVALGILLSVTALPSLGSAALLLLEGIFRPATGASEDGLIGGLEVGKGQFLPKLQFCLMKEHRLLLLESSRTLCAKPVHAIAQYLFIGRFECRRFENFNIIE
jgi:hypothetical protein